MNKITIKHAGRYYIFILEELSSLQIKNMAYFLDMQKKEVLMNTFIKEIPIEDMYDVQQNLDAVIEDINKQIKIIKNHLAVDEGFSSFLPSSTCKCGGRCIC